MEENNINKSNKIKMFILTMLILLVSVAGISYAYFTIQITGNDTASSMRLRTANMSLVYNDVQIVSGEYVTPGWSDTKTLTVTNNGNVTAYYTIIWRDLINEIINNELVISATCSSTSGSCPTISETVVPTTNPEGHNINVKKNIEIPVGVTHTYTLTAEFIETGSNQNYNQNKYFNGTLNIAEGKDVTLRRMGTDTSTGLPVVKVGTEEFLDLTNAIDYSSFDSAFKTVINYDSSKSILLAKYNLYVGLTCTASGINKCTPIDTSVSGYGLQSSNIGYSGSYPAIGIVPFSGSSNTYGYWDSGGSGINSTYGTYTNRANNIYDADCVTAPNYSVAFYNNAGNASYSVAYYVENYINTLGIDGTGRLLTYPEANALTQTQRNNGKYYWLGSAASNIEVFHENLYSSRFDYVGSFGVRPVIIVNTSDIQSS